MELRKDPITLSWMLVGDAEESVPEQSGCCPLCPETAASILKGHLLFSAGDVRAFPHPYPVYHIEGDEDRAAEGIYDRMRTLGAHEVLVESAAHDRDPFTTSDHEVECVLRAYAQRIFDLKKDKRFRYITAYKNRGRVAGEEFAHAHSEITATPFIPRRMVYELRAARQHFQMKERCVFCDIVRQEESNGVRVVEATANYIALCPFASRVPYEMWVLPRYHSAAYEDNILERGDVLELAGLMRRSLARVERITDAFHMVLHTTPNTRSRRGITEQWTTLHDDYHWHFEILPISEKRTKSYSIKEVYFSPVSPEQGAARLRSVL